jgi:integrase/recombinase XerD
MIDKAISPLRQRMIEDMTIRNFSPSTQKDYIRGVKTFAAFLGYSPSKENAEDIRRYQLHMTATGASVLNMNAAVSALRFLFKVTSSGSLDYTTRRGPKRKMRWPNAMPRAFGW